MCVIAQCRQQCVVCSQSMQTAVVHDFDWWSPKRSHCSLFILPDWKQRAWSLRYKWIYSCSAAWLVPCTLCGMGVTTQVVAGWWYFWRHMYVSYVWVRVVCGTLTYVTFTLADYHAMLVVISQGTGVCRLCHVASAGVWQQLPTGVLPVLLQLSSVWTHVVRPLAPAWGRSEVIIFASKPQKSRAIWQCTVNDPVLRWCPLGNPYRIKSTTCDNSNDYFPASYSWMLDYSLYVYSNIQYFAILQG